MRTFAFLASAAALSFSSVSFVASAEEVLTLTDSTFEDVVKENQFVLAEFYAPWCGHCKALAPEFEKAATDLKDFEPKVVLAKIDATEEKELGTRFEVQGFPTLKWFVDGEPLEYSGGRTADTIVSWIKKKTGPACTKVNDSASLTTFKGMSDAVILGAFATEAEKAAFESAAKAEDKVPYGYIIGDAALAKEAGIDSVPGVVALRTFDEPKIAFSGDITSSDEIKEFVQGASLPLVVTFSQESAQRIFSGPVKKFLFLFAEEGANTAGLIDEMKPAATEFQGKLACVHVKGSEDRIMEFFGLTKGDLPALKGVNMEDGMKKYGFSGDIKADAIKKMGADFLAGSLTPELKSEDIPAEPREESGVYVLVGKSFDDVVNKAGTDVLVEFYAPWCGHCKKLVPIYDELAIKYKDNEKLIIAKMDSTANEVDSVSIQGFPTLKFFPADATEPMDYDGARDLDGFVTFLEANAKSLK